MSRIKKTRTYSVVTACENFEDVVIADLEKAGLESPDDIEDVEYAMDGAKIKYTFWVETNKEETDD